MREFPVRCNASHRAMKIPQLLFTTVAALSLLASVPAMAAKTHTMRNIVSVTGTCTEFTLGGFSKTQDCTGHVANVEFSDKVVGFAFQAENPSSHIVVTLGFYGPGLKQVHTDADTVLQPIDHVVVSMTGKQGGTAVKVIGQCRYTNPFKGTATIQCSVQASDGEVKASFTTDGTEPKIKYF
jgi:hypothetical protein